MENGKNPKASGGQCMEEKARTFDVCTVQGALDPAKQNKSLCEKFKTVHNTQV